jgi:hypothetical protein
LNLRDKRQVTIGLALVCLALFGAGIGYFVSFGRHHTICPGGATPVQQLDQGMGQIVYRCPGRVTVTGSALP